MNERGALRVLAGCLQVLVLCAAGHASSVPAQPAGPGGNPETRGGAPAASPGACGEFVLEQYLAAGKVLRGLDARHGPAPSGLSVDGRPMCPAQQGAARVLYEMQEELDADRLEHHRAAGTRLFDKGFDKVEKQIRKLEKHKLGKKAAAVVFQDPEQVDRKVCVRVFHEEGCPRLHPVSVLRRGPSLRLQYTSMAFETLSLTPVVGRLFPFAGSLGVAASALPAVLVLKKDLARAMLRTSRKLFGVGLVGMVPGIHSAVGASAAAIDLRNVHSVSASPAVTEADGSDCRNEDACSREKEKDDEGTGR